MGAWLGLERNDGVKRPMSNGNEGSTPALGDAQGGCRLCHFRGPSMAESVARLDSLAKERRELRKW
jgi:hypothetical protein